MLAAEMAADQDAEPGARAAAGLFGELQRETVGGHDVVTSDGAFILDAEDLVEIDAAERHKGGGGIGWRPAATPVEGRHGAGPHKTHSPRPGGDAGGAPVVVEGG